MNIDEVIATLQALKEDAGGLADVVVHVDEFAAGRDHLITAIDTDLISENNQVALTVSA